MFRRIDIYIARVFFVRFCVIMFGSIALFQIIDIATKLSIQSPIMVILKFSLSNVFNIINETIFFIILSASIWFLYTINRSSESKIIANAGYSPFRMLLPVNVAVLGIALLYIFLYRGEIGTRVINYSSRPIGTIVRGEQNIPLLWLLGGDGETIISLYNVTNDQNIYMADVMDVFHGDSMQNYTNIVLQNVDDKIYVSPINIAIDINFRVLQQEFSSAYFHTTKHPIFSGFNKIHKFKKNHMEYKRIEVDIYIIIEYAIMFFVGCAIPFVTMYNQNLRSAKGASAVLLTYVIAYICHVGIQMLNIIFKSYDFLPSALVLMPSLGILVAVYIITIQQKK